MRRALLVGVVLGLGACGRLHDFRLNEGFTVSQTMASRCRSTTGDERLIVQILGLGTAVCWESIFEEGISTGRSCSAFQNRVADSDCGEPAIINSPNVVNLGFRIGPDRDLPSADYLGGRWWQCEDGELESASFDGPAFFSLRDKPELVLGDRDLHGVLRVNDCGDIDGRIVVDTDIDTDIDTEPLDTGRPDTGDTGRFDTAAGG